VFPKNDVVLTVEKRLENERKFKSWETLPNGGRVYRLMVAGRRGWSAQYVKEVTAEEETVRFVQEIYDDQGVLVEIHEKFPVDTGHNKLKP
jgi:hypothetical protein